MSTFTPSLEGFFMNADKVLPHAEKQDFPHTRWSLVKRAGSNSLADAQAAVADLCGIYWYPVYAFIRLRGNGPHDAEDLTQGFFAKWLEDGSFARAEAQRGRLRSYLLTSVQHFLCDTHKQTCALKRGSGMLVSFDALSAEERYASEPLEELSPARLYDRSCVLQILERALQALGKYYALKGKTRLFTVLRGFLDGSPQPPRRYDELCAELSMFNGTLRSEVSRLQKRWRETVLEQAAEILGSPTRAEAEAELAELLSCFPQRESGRPRNIPHEGCNAATWIP